MNEASSVFKYCVNLLILSIFIGGFTPSNAIAQNKDEQAVRQLLNDQLQGWNKGDIESYMKGYWNSDSLVFIGKNGVKYGYKTTLENYKKSYPDTSAMGKLTFDLLEVKRLSPIYFSVIGNWHLQRTIGDLQGYFTLLIKQIKGKWVIVMDHSS
jgi:ketosteroid isomerase-like protein